MAPTLPDPIDASHLAPCARCGTLNGISARWCWRCDAALAADAAPLPRSVPAVVFDAPLAQVAQPGGPVLDAAGIAVVTSAPPRFDPPLLTEPIEGFETAPATEPPQPAAARRPARNGRLAMLASVAFVAAGVVAYVQVREVAQPDLDRLPPPSAGPVARPDPPPPPPPPSPAAAAVPAAVRLAPTPAAPASGATPPAVPRPPARAASVRAPSTASTPPPPKSRPRVLGERAPPASQRAAARGPATARASPTVGAAVSAPAPTPRPVPRTRARAEPARADATPAAPPAPPPMAGPCTPNAAALGLCKPS